MRGKHRQQARLEENCGRNELVRFLRGKMKALFLDIDGVVCLHGKENANEDEIFDGASCRRLREIIDATGCKLVLTSSWRLFPESIRSMFRQFKPFGITKENFLGRTPLRDDRGDEVMVYLKRHPQIDRFVALDDQPFYSKGFPQERLILTKEESGITEEIKVRCIAILHE